MMFSSINIPGTAHKINPVLDAFRECVVERGVEHTAALAAAWNGNFAGFWWLWRGGRIPARKAHREHAKRVFARLAKL